jgi:diguanylate cyclase (GGDEF)-like protein
VALLDLDNFRLLNDTYGHGAGDRALLAVASLLDREAPPGTAFGRYGPDEFLVIAPASEASQLEPAILRLRAALADATLQFETSERLPVTISTGLCSFPTHGESVTDLLSVAAVTLAEAKASGGDAVRVADRGPAEPAAAGGFDVLQGLVLAVDTKDRYTKRHSEDVARYGVFLAEQLSLEPDVLRTVRAAGLLHDVGKIGIPDTVLRKPGKLTPAEHGIVQQHVALGDIIVRDLPNIDAIRAGIRHHHERWDGKGYLDHLEGDEIPLIARILAVGDAFSAMTTTRPYRKALPTEEALRRLEDAAGTQLDERLVRVFVAAIESVPNAPRPGETPSARLWLPDRRIA